MVSEAGQSDRYFVGLLTVALAPFFAVKQSEDIGWIYLGCRRDDCQMQKGFRRVRKIAKSDYELRHVCPSTWNNPASIERIFMKFGI
jgi:hypothetical protein